MLDSKTFARETDPRIRFGKPYTINDSDINRWYTGNIDEIAFTVLNSSNVAEYSGDTAPVPTEGYPDEVRSPGIVIDGLFLSTSKPKANQKGLLVNNKFFIPFAESSEGGSGGDTSAFESDAMAIIGTPTGGGSLSYPEGYYLTMNAEAISLTYNFTQTDATATGLNRVWETNDGIYRLKAEPSGDENNYYWGIYTIQNNTQIYSTNQSGNINPWAILGWHSETGGVSIVITWTVSEAVA